MENGLKLEQYQHWPVVERLRAAMRDPSATFGAVMAEITRTTGLSQSQILLSTLALALICALLGPVVQLVFLALALVWPILSSIQLLQSPSNPVAPSAVNDRRRDELLAYWTLFGCQHLLLDCLLGSLLGPFLLLWPIKLAFIGALLMAQWNGGNFQQFLRPLRTLMDANLPQLNFNFPFGTVGHENARKIN